MWSAKCVYCGKELVEKEPCYPVYEGVEKGYRHTTCYPPHAEQPKDYVQKPFGHVTDEDLSREGR